jgi:hypothetical protein
MNPDSEKPVGPWAWLLVIPFVALLVVPLYNFKDPVIAGFPFFYWYQFLWIPITSVLIYLVYRRMR